MSKRVVKKNKPAPDVARSEVDLSWKGLYRIAGICLLVTGPLWIIGAILSVMIGGAPGASEEYLQAVSSHVLLSQINFAIFALTDFLLLPAVLALYFSLKHVNKNAMLIAAALLLTYIFVDLAVTEQNSLSLVVLTQQYAAAGDVQRSAFAAAANYALASLPLATFYSFFVSSVGWLIVNIVMLKGVYSRFSAFAGIFMSSMGILASFYGLVPLLGLFLSPCLIAFGVWTILVGAQLLRLGNPVALRQVRPAAA